MNTLTKEQERAANSVKEVLVKKGLPLNQSLEGKKEKYILFQIGLVKIYLYFDGEANIQVLDGKGALKVDQRYELADFDHKHTLLLDALAKNLEALL